MKRVEGPQRFPRSDVAGELAHRWRHLPQVAPGPDRGDLPFGVTEAPLGSRGGQPKPQDRPGRLNQRQTRRYQELRAADPLLDLWSAPNL